MPKVSVIMISYNNAKFIEEAILSVINQSYQDFELIITDCGSSDNSLEIIKKLQDKYSKIKANFLDHHQINSIAFDNSYAKTSSEYIAIIDANDIWEKTKLDEQVNFLEKNVNVGAVFSKVTAINKENREIEHILENIINTIENKTRFQWLNYFFNIGNPIYHPSILVRKKCYDKCGKYKRELDTLADFDMLIRLCMEYEIYIIQKPLIKSNNKINSINKEIKTELEYSKILENYYHIQECNDFNKIFYDEPEIIDKELIPYYLGKFALKNIDSNPHKIFGVFSLYNFFSDYRKVEKYEKKIDMSYKDLHSLVKQTNLSNINLSQIEHLKEILKNHKIICNVGSFVRKLIHIIYYKYFRDILYNPLFFYKRITTKKNKIKNNPPKIAVHLHLFYMSLTDEFILYLKNISTNFDLFVTVNESLIKKDEIEKINKNFKNVTLIVLPSNKGRDIGAFIYFINQIKLEKYDLILRLHTKKTTMSSFEKHLSRGKDFQKSRHKILSNDLWRKHNLDSILGSKAIVKKVLKIFQNNSVGMIGDKAFLLGNYYTNKCEREYFRSICKDLNLFKDISFFAGTIFWIRADLLNLIKDNYTIDSFDAVKSSKKNGELEHGFERIFGTLVKSQGYKVKGI